MFVCFLRAPSDVLRCGCSVLLPCVGVCCVVFVLALWRCPPPCCGALCCGVLYCNALACLSLHAFLLAALFLFVLCGAPCSALLGAVMCAVCGAGLALGLGSCYVLSGALLRCVLWQCPCCVMLSWVVVWCAVFFGVVPSYYVVLRAVFVFVVLRRGVSCFLVSVCCDVLLCWCQVCCAIWRHVVPRCVTLFSAVWFILACRSLPCLLSWRVLPPCSWAGCFVALLCCLKCVVCCSWCRVCRASCGVLCCALLACLRRFFLCRALLPSVAACGLCCLSRGLAVPCCLLLAHCGVGAPVWLRNPLPCCLLWFVVMPCSPALCHVVLCLRVVLCCCALLSFLLCRLCLIALSSFNHHS